MNWIQLAVVSPLTELVISSANGATPEQVGVTRMRAGAEQLHQTQVHAVEAVEDLQQLLGRRRLSGLDEVAQDRMDLLPARMAHEGSQGAQRGRPPSR